jgi:hypothetical protein
MNLRFTAAAAAVVAFGATAALFGQQAQSPSTFSHTTKGGEETVVIHNVAYEMTGTNVPGRPKDQRLVLRTTIHSEEVIGDIPEDGKVTLEAWPLGTPFTQKPIYSVTMPGHDAQTLESAVWVVRHGDVDVDEWSVLKLGTGQPLFNSFVPVVQFSISRETVTTRYVGLDVPTDDVKDARLKEPHVVGIIEYASEDKVLHEALITCDDLKQAGIVRGLEDTTRTLFQADRALTISFIDNYPGAASTLTVRVPVANDDLDLAHAQLPKGLHVAAFRR